MNFKLISYDEAVEAQAEALERIQKARELLALLYDDLYNAYDIESDEHWAEVCVSINNADAAELSELSDEVHGALEGYGEISAVIYGGLR